jgi:hypothetical protein
MFAAVLGAQQPARTPVGVWRNKSVAPWFKRLMSISLLPAISLLGRAYFVSTHDN